METYSFATKCGTCGTATCRNAVAAAEESLPKVVALKNLADELHEFVDKNHNVHKESQWQVVQMSTNENRTDHGMNAGANA